MFKKKKPTMGRPSKGVKKLTVYVQPATKLVLKKAVKKLPKKPHPTQGMIIDAWAQQHAAQQP